MIDKIVKDIKSLTGKYGIYEVFDDLVECMFISHMNATIYRAELEEKYMGIVAKHNRATMIKFGEIAGAITLLMHERARDVLGEIYMKLEVNNKDLEQYYTPTGVSDVNAKLLMNKADIDRAIGDKGFVSIYEPTAGSGGLIFEYWNEFRRMGYNPQTQLEIEAWDIDSRACKMCFIQLSMVGAKAVVRNIDTIRLEEWDRYITLNYLSTGKLFNKQGRNER